jgi:hypothetical protein
MLREARQHARRLGSDLTALKARAQRGIDADAVRGLDDVAASMAAMFPEHFGGRESPEDRLFDLLAAGNPVPMTEDKAYAQALEHLRADRQGGNADFDFGANADDGDEGPVPFRR